MAEGPRAHTAGVVYCAREREDDVRPISSPSAGPVLAIAVAAALFAAPARAGEPTPADAHPSLLLDAERLAEARRRADRSPWGQALRADLVRRADRLLDQPVVIPDRGGQWSHYYVCKPCGGVRLKTVGPTEHRCPKCGATYSGWPYDDVHVTRVHQELLRRAHTLALAYALSGEARYAAGAGRILVGYARRYPDYPRHDRFRLPTRSGARLFAQTLDEAVAFVDVAWTYDLVAASGALDTAQRRAVEDDLLREAAKVIRRNDKGISNWQSWHNAALGAIGRSVGDAKLFRAAIDGKSGLRFQLRRSVRPDGWWHEGTPAYHFYALRPLLRLGLIARAAGDDVLDEPAFKRLFDAPLALTMPDGRFPALNDSDTFPIAGQAALYDLAYGIWGDPRHAAVARQRPRGVDALLLGAAELPDVEPPPVASVRFDGLGVAVLRQGSGPGAYALLDYGPHGGGHGHFDKLGFVFHAGGSELCPDAGRLQYGTPLHRTWYKQTVAHNTVVLDERSQAAATGALELFGAGGAVQVVRASVDGAYPGARLDRTLVLVPEGLFDVVRVATPREARIDWVLHTRGEPVLPGGARPASGPAGEAGGYQHVELVAELVASEPWTAEWRQPDGSRLRLVQAAAAGRDWTRVRFGTGPGQPPGARLPLVIARRRGREATFVSFLERLEPGEDDRPRPTVRLLPATADGVPDPERALALELVRGDVRQVILVGAAGVTKATDGLASREAAARVWSY